MSNSILTNSRCVMIVSGPSGSGKSTLCNMISETDSDIVPSISYTTRMRRNTEVEGEDYKFVSHEFFQSLIDKGLMLEYVEIYGNFYGTPIENIKANALNNKDTLFDIESRGAKLIKAKMPTEAFSVFVMPSSLAELANRLKLRGQNSSAEIELRLAGAKKEIAQLRSYDYVIINDDLNKATQDLKAILRAERLRASRMKDLFLDLD